MEGSIKRVLDYSDYLAAPDDGNRYEILRGELFVTPAPRPAHQRISLRLSIALVEYFHRRGAGEVFPAPTDLILTNHDIAQPDLVVVADPAQITNRGIEGAPLLVVEILSDSTAGRDRGVKARRYAELGIPHYWIVDGANRCVECHRLDGTRYAVTAVADGDTTLTHPDFDELTIPLERLWAESAR